MVKAHTYIFSVHTPSETAPSQNEKEWDMVGTLWHTVTPVEDFGCMAV